ncbi:MAG: hypothetical protein Q9170_002345 [Blastenia crenularia]
MLASKLSTGAPMMDGIVVSNALHACEEANELVDEIRSTEVDPDKAFTLDQSLIHANRKRPSKSTPYLLSRIAEVRAILEELSPQQRKDNPLVTEAYGKSFYKCPVLHCVRFEQGFSTRKQRDEHVAVHERAFKCTEDSCDYSTIGFARKVQVASHIKLCHRPAPEAYTFPETRRSSLADALKHAIDKDDVFAVREIGAEMSAHPSEETGFLFRAVRRRNFDVAFVLLEILGPDEMNYTTKDKRTVLHEAVQAMHMDFLTRILDTSINVNAKDSIGRTPLVLALECNHFDAVRLLWDSTDRKLKPLENWWMYSYRIWRKGFMEASSRGHDDLLGRIFSSFVEQNERREHRSGRLATTILEALIKAALNHHESTVTVILEIGRKMDIEKNYPTRLQNALLTGMEGIRMLEKPEVDVNGKTKGNALGRSIRKGDERTVTRLLESGADINYYSASVHFNALGAAVYWGNLSMVNLLLDRGAEVNARCDRSGGTALCIAVSFGERGQIIQVLLDNGADINLQNKIGYTPLHVAATRKHEKVVQLLLDEGADIDAHSEPHGTALYQAVQEGREKVVQMLLSRGANVDTKCGFGTALYRASSKGYDRIVRVLLENGADVDVNEDALQAASLAGHANVVQTLLDNGADIDAGGHRRTALQRAVEGRHRKVVQLLLSRGADVNAAGESSDSALQIAASRGYEELVEILLDKGADIDPWFRRDGTTLSTAARGGYKRLVQILLDKGADVNGVDESLDSVLQTAASSGHEKAVQLLLDEGADVDAHVHYHGTALRAASKAGHEKIVQALLDRGADINAGGGQYGTALQAASFRGHEKLVQILLDGGANVNIQDSQCGTALQAALAGRRNSVVRLLLNNGADIDALYRHYSTALKLAAVGGHEKLVQMLLDKGADINAQYGISGTALQIAIEKGHEKLVQMLLDRGADVNAQGLDGMALNVAAMQRNEKVVQILLDKGADVNTRGIHGTPLQIAIRRGHEKVAQLLKDRGATTNAQTPIGQSQQTTWDTITARQGDSIARDHGAM